jgi:hypothetical protein
MLNGYPEEPLTQEHDKELELFRTEILKSVFHVLCALS